MTDEEMAMSKRARLLIGFALVMVSLWGASLLLIDFLNRPLKLTAAPSQVHMYSKELYELIWAALGEAQPIEVESAGIVRLFGTALTADLRSSPVMPKGLSACSASSRLAMSEGHIGVGGRMWPLYFAGSTAWVSRNWSAIQILNFVAERSYFSHGVRGIDEASKSYFGKRPANLTIEEVAIIGGMLQSPAYNDPWCSPSQSLDAANVILRRLGAKRLETLPATLVAAPDTACRN